MKFTAIALLIASVSSIKLHGDGTPQNQHDYWARENAIAKGNAEAAAATAASAKAAKADAAAVVAAAAAKKALADESKAVVGNVADQTAQNMHPSVLKNQ